MFVRALKARDRSTFNFPNDVAIHFGAVGASEFIYDNDPGRWPGLLHPRAFGA
jgi:hypothetical protein